LKVSSIRNYYKHIALFASLLFACHPVQTQGVTYIFQRVTSLAATFYLLSLIAYIKWRLLNLHPHSTSGRFLKINSLSLYLTSVIAAVLAMLTKQIAFMLPVAIALYEFMFFEGKIKRRIFYLIPLLLTMTIIPLSLIGTGKLTGDLIEEVNMVTRGNSDLSRLEYLFTEFRVIVTYIRLIFLPINQNLDYNYPTYHTFFDREVFLSFFLHVLIVGSCIYLFYRYRSPASHIILISFGVFWFYMNLVLESSIIPLYNVISEHRVYLPSIGLFIVISTFLFIVVKKFREGARWVEVGMIVFVSGLVVALTVGTHARNNVWKNEFSLWEDVVRKSPENAKGHNNLGLAYETVGLVEEAIEQYKIAIELEQDFAEAYNNLGNVYQRKSLIDKAIENYEAALKFRPGLSGTYSNLGLAYQKKGLIDKALENYEVALKLRPYLPEAHYNIGLIYLTEGFLDKSIERFKIAVQLKPDWQMPHFLLGRIYLEKGIIESAQQEFKTVLRLNPGHIKAQEFLDNISR
jgi:Tfp pilus assembly protein PilF